MNGLITNVVVSVVSGVLTASGMLYLSNKGGDAEKIKQLTITNDSIRESNKTIRAHLVIVTAMYQHTDSVLEATLKDTTKSRIRYEAINATHANLPVDSAVLLFIARSRGNR